MNVVQKIIKYLAIALAIFIIINIVSVVLSVLYGLSWISGATKDVEIIESQEEIYSTIGNTDITTLKIELNASNLEIKNGEMLRVETNNLNVKCNQEGSQLIIKDKTKNWFSKRSDESQIILYMPANMLWDSVKIDSGAGELNIEELATRNFDFDMGAGKVVIKKLNVSNKTEIDGGAGKIEILSGAMNNLKLNTGVGDFSLNAKLTGRNDVNAGVGKLNFNLTDGTENYKIKVNKGIGSITIDGNETTDGNEYGHGETYIDIDGGVGAIEIK